MDKLDIILTVMSGGFGLTFALMLVMWNNLNSRIDSLNIRIDSINMSLSQRIDKLDEKITDIDRRLCRIEGAMSAKECCVLTESRQVRKAE